jgi:hypothetical protein
MKAEGGQQPTCSSSSSSSSGPNRSMEEGSLTPAGPASGRLAFLCCTIAAPLLLQQL